MKIAFKEISKLFGVLKRQETLKNKFFIAFVIILSILGVLGLYVLSLGITVGIVKLITLCFGLTFKIQYAVGIWLVMLLFNMVRK